MPNRKKWKTRKKWKNNLHSEPEGGGDRVFGKPTGRLLSKKGNLSSLSLEVGGGRSKKFRTAPGKERRRASNTQHERVPVTNMQKGGPGHERGVLGRKKKREDTPKTAYLSHPISGARNNEKDGVQKSRV